MRDIVYFITVLCINLVTCDSTDCTVKNVNHGTIIDNHHSVGDVVPDSTNYTVSCATGYQLADLTTADISCITGQIPLSCRELKIIYTALEYATQAEVKLTCRVTADDTVTGVTWTKDDQVFRETGTFAANQTSPYQSILTFSATLDDSGEYGCEATLDTAEPYDTETFTDIVDITILGVVMGPEDEDPVYLLLGEDFPLVCNFTNMPSYTLDVLWKMGAGTVTNIYIETIDTIVTSYMTLEATAVPNRSNNYTCAGTYKNIGDNSQIYVSTSKRLEIRGIKTQPSSLYMGVDNDAVFTCVAVGETQGEVEWLIADTIQNASLYTVEYTSSSRTTKTILTLDAVQKQNSAVKCEVTFGDETLVSDVVVLNVFGIGFITMPSDSGFAEEGDYELSCVVQSETNITTAIKWYKGSDTMPSEKYSTSSNADNTVYTSLLYFEDVETADIGSYKCRVDYFISDETTTMYSDPATVYVREVRFRTQSGTDWVVSTSDTDQQIFTCYYSGDTEAGTGVEAVSWWANGVNVDGVDNFTITEGTNWKSIMKMTNISPELAGSIECRYDCGVGGSISGEGYLYVHRQIELPATTMTSSATTTITCSARTNEAATVSWFEGSTPLSLNDANFAANEATVEDYTQYNTLVVTDWSQTKDVTTITCKYRYDTTGEEYETSTEFIFKGFTTGPDRYTYYLPDEKTLNCYFGYSYTTAAPTEGSWYRDGVSLVGNNRYETSEELQSGMFGIGLRIKAESGDVILEDSGAYTCSIVYSEDEVYNRTSDINFYSISVSPQESAFYDSFSLNLTCTLESAGIAVSSVEWTVGEVDLPPPAFTTTFSGNTTTLAINQVLEENSGTYTCHFVVPGGKRLKEVKYLEISNIEMLRGEYITVALGDNLQLSCSVANFTQVHLKWYKDEELVDHYEHLSFQSLVLTSTITISDIQLDDLGEYECGISDSRSRKSTTLSASEIDSTSTTITEGFVATVSCQLSGSTAEPTSVYWTDVAGTEYKSTDSSEVYTVTTGDYLDGEQTTTLEISGVGQTAQYTCNFLIDGVTSNRKPTVHVLYITTTPALVYIGSPAAIQCRVEGSPSVPSARWTGLDSDTEYTISTADYVPSEGKLNTELHIKEVLFDDSLMCVFTIDSVEFSKTVQVEVYEVSVLDSYLTLRATDLEMVLQMQPQTDDISQLVMNLTITPNTTVNGAAAVSGLTVTFSKVIGVMTVGFQFIDNGGTTRNLASTVYVSEFSSPIVSLSEGSIAAILTCRMSGVVVELWDELSTFWMVGETKRYEEFRTAGTTVITEYMYDMTGSSVDQIFTCGVELWDATYTNTAILDIIEFVCTEEVTLTTGLAQSISCQISGSQHIEPIKAIWYQGNEQRLIQDLTDSGWPDPLITTLNDVTLPGNYRCVLDFGITEFTRTITVVSGGDDPDDNVDPTPTPEPPISSSQTALIVGIMVPIILVIIIVAIVSYCYLKKFRIRRASFSHNVKTLSLNSNSHGRPESLIYHNQTGLTRAEMYEQRSDKFNSANNYQNFQNSDRSASQTPNSGFGSGDATAHPLSVGRNTPVNRDGAPRRAPTPGDGAPRRAPTPGDGASRRAPTPAGKYNRDFNAEDYSRNLKLSRDDYQSSRA